MTYNYGIGGKSTEVTEETISVQDAVIRYSYIPAEEIIKSSKDGKVTIGTMKWNS